MQQNCELSQLLTWLGLRTRFVPSPVVGGGVVSRSPAPWASAASPPLSTGCASEWLSACLHPQANDQIQQYAQYLIPVYCTSHGQTRMQKWLRTYTACPSKINHPRTRMSVMLCSLGQAATSVFVFVANESTQATWPRSSTLYAHSHTLAQHSRNTRATLAQHSHNTRATLDA